MNPMKLADATRRFGAPDNWDEAKNGPCRTLEIVDRDGFMISGWKPTPDELERLNRGDPVFLSISGSVHPVVSLSVGYENETAEHRAARAAVIIAGCEQDLRRTLSAGEKRDLLLDNTSWTREEVEAIVPRAKAPSA